MGETLSTSAISTTLAHQLRPIFCLHQHVACILASTNTAPPPATTSGERYAVEVALHCTAHERVGFRCRAGSYFQFIDHPRPGQLGDVLSRAKTSCWAQGQNLPLRQWNDIGKITTGVGAIRSGYWNKNSPAVR